MLDKPTISIVSLAAQDLSATKRTLHAPRQAVSLTVRQFRVQQLSKHWHKIPLQIVKKENAISWLVNQFLLFSLL